MKRPLTNLPGWSVKSVADVSDRVVDRSGADSSPYIEIGDVDPGRKDYVLKEKPSPGLCISVKENDIVISKVRPTRGAIARVLGNAFVSPAFSVRRARKKEDTFLFHRLSQPDFFRYLGSVETGTTYPSCDDIDIETYTFLFPESIEERLQISTILSDVNDLVTETDQLINKYERLKEGLIQSLLLNGLDSTGVIRNQQTHEFKISPIGKIPVEWSFCKLGDFLERNGGYVQTGPFGSQLHSYEYVQDGVPVVMPQDIERGQIVLDKIARVTPKKAKTLERHMLKENDIVFARRGELNRGAAIKAYQAGWLCGTGCLLFRPNAKVLSAEWFSLIYSSPLIQRQLEAIAVGSTMKNINTGVIHSLKIAIPDLEEQRRITDVIDRVSDLINQERFKKRKISLKREGLASDLLTGRVRVKGK